MKVSSVGKHFDMIFLFTTIYSCWGIVSMFRKIYIPEYSKEFACYLSEQADNLHSKT
jgi:hypothetical protein